MDLQVIERQIYLIRGQRVMLSPDLARLYSVPVKVLIRAVKRNADRFPSVLNSDKAIQVNISIMRTFVKVREAVALHKELSAKVIDHDRKIDQILAAIERMAEPPSIPSKKIGFEP